MEKQIIVVVLQDQDQSANLQCSAGLHTQF